MPDPEEHPPEQLADQRLEVAGSREHQIESEHGGEQPEDPSRQSALRGEHSDLPAKRLPLAKRPGHRGEQLREVAADLTLDPDCHHHPGEVLALHPFSDAFHGVLDRDAESCLDERAVELPADGLLVLTHNGVHRLRHGVAGGQAAGDQLQRVRQLTQECGRPPRLLDEKVGPWEAQPRGEPEDGRNDPPTGDEQQDQRGASCDAEVDQHPLGRPQRHSGRFQPQPQVGFEVPPVDDLAGKLDSTPRDLAAAQSGCRLLLLHRRPSGERVEREPTPYPAVRLVASGARQRDEGDREEAEEEHRQQDRQGALGHDALLRRDGLWAGVRQRVGRRADRKVLARTVWPPALALTTTCADLGTPAGTRPVMLIWVRRSCANCV